MHQSWFSYKLSRPYPFKWFTPTALAGAIILAVLFSLVNLAANGYYITQIYTTDPNTTVTARDFWFMKAPFNWGDALHPSCEPRLVSVGDRFFTSNLGFYYEIASITQWDDQQGIAVSLGSTPYLNNTLEDCRAQKITLNLQKSDTFANVIWWISWSGSTATTTSQCTFTSEAGPVNITFTSNYGVGGDSNTDYVIDQNYTTKASVWWGTRLMNAYWFGVTSAMSYSYVEGDETYWTRGTFEYSWNDTDKRSIQDLDFFRLTFFLLNSDATVANDDNTNLDNATAVAAVYNNPNVPGGYSPAMTEGLYFAKLMHSLIAVDLGNAHLPNLLLDVDSLQYILTNPDDINRQPEGILNGTVLPSGYTLYAQIPAPGAAPLVNRTTISESYNLFSDQTGSLGTKNATIFARYSCSVPARKSTGTMLLAILIADLVFLQAAWMLLTVAADQIVERKDPLAMFCQGCAKVGQYESVAMGRLTPRTPVNEDAESTTSLFQRS